MALDDKNVLVDLGYHWESRLMGDFGNPIQLRYTVTLDHELDDELVAKAWERTKRVYPLVDATLGFERDPSLYAVPDAMEAYYDDHLYLVKAEGGANEPQRSRVPVSPYTDAVGRRLICISYFGRNVSLSAYHTIVDGGGMTMILRTFLYAYLTLRTGHEDENPVVELREGRSPQEYYTNVASAYLGAQTYVPTPLYSLPFGCKGFYDKDMTCAGPNPIQGALKLDAAAFMRLCKESGANPSAMISALLARVAYALNPEEHSDIVFNFTMSARGTLGIEDSIANANGSLLAYATRSDVEGKSLAEVAQRIRTDVNAQRGRDYYLTFRKSFYTYQRKLLSKARTVTYVGALDIGDNNGHIVDFNMETFATSNLYLMQLNESFVLMLAYGNATQRYLEGFVRAFRDLGVDAEVTRPAYCIVRDSKTAVV